MKSILPSTILPLLLFLSSCQENRNKAERTQDIAVFKNLIKKKVFIPSSVKWDTLKFLPQSEQLLLHQNFPVFYFKDDTTLYLIRSENEINKTNKNEPDSIQLLVENVEIFKGCYRISGKMNLININLKIESDYIHDSIKDTISIIDYKALILNYGKSKYIIPNNLTEASYKSINEYVYHMPYQEGHESEMEPSSQ